MVQRRKGAQEAPCTPPECGWPQPPPAVRLGTTTISSLVILLRIDGSDFPKVARNIPAGPQKSRQGRKLPSSASLAGFLAPGECDFAPRSMQGASRSL